MSIQFTSIDLFRDAWMISSHVEVGYPGGMHLDTPPVRIIALDNLNELARTLEDVLNEDVDVISENEFSERRLFPTIKAKALRVKSDRLLQKYGRSFTVANLIDKVQFQEDKRIKAGAYSGTIWFTSWTAERSIPTST